MLPLVLGATIGELSHHSPPLHGNVFIGCPYVSINIIGSLFLSVGWGAFALHESKPSETQDATQVYMAEQYDAVMTTPPKDD